MGNEELVQLIKHGIDSVGNMEQLYIKNQGIIFSVVKKYRYACQADYNSTPIIELDELMHEAYFGLVKAVESFDESQGVLFMSYASHWIGQAVKRYLDNCGSVIRVPVHTQEKVYQYNRVTTYFIQHFNREPSIKEYSKWMGLSVKSIERLRNFMFKYKIKSLDASIPDNDEELTLVDIVAGDTDIESEIIDKVSNEDLHNKLWDMIKHVLNVRQVKGWV
jgi:RNA polymerase primary sigma factor